MPVLAALNSIVFCISRRTTSGISSRRPMTLTEMFCSHDRGTLLDHVLLEQVHQKAQLAPAAASSSRSTGNRASAARYRAGHTLRSMRRTLATPRRCPSIRGKPCRWAQRPLPSMMMAMCRGRRFRRAGRRRRAHQRCKWLSSARARLSIEKGIVVPLFVRDGLGSPRPPPKLQCTIRSLRPS